MASKAHCPACSARMKAKDKFCGDCGQRNPLFPAEGQPGGQGGVPAGAREVGPPGDGR